jgi:ribosomal protein S18 acetylase RimI-like enzyme
VARVTASEFLTTINQTQDVQIDMIIRSFAADDAFSVITLWETCGLTRAWNNPMRDIERKSHVQPQWFVVGELNCNVIATAMFGYDGHRGWVNYLAVSPQHQRKNYARQIMEHGEQLLLSAGCPKLSLQVRSTNTEAMAFYERLGYKTDEAISMGKRLIPDD